jgi:HEPN domain-containing protein
MELDRTKTFWLEEAEEAKQVAEHLFEKKDYSYSLFFGHLAIEKTPQSTICCKKSGAGTLYSQSAQTC